MAMRRVGSGLLHLHAMTSLEPLVLGDRGYPLLLQTGETYKGAPLVDRQHPHDAFMELAAMFQQPLSRSLALELYAGLAGEPAIGPVAFMHRPSADADPLAPLGHHGQDATHITFGVATAGIYSQQWKIEGSVFNGREPDENRWDLDLGSLNSWSARVTVNPVRRLSVAAWYGNTDAEDELHPGETARRFGLSALHGGKGIAGGRWSTTLMVAGVTHGDHTQRSALVESNLGIGRATTVFGRFEQVGKSAEELALATDLAEDDFDIRSLVLGFSRELVSISEATISLGARGSVNFVPESVAKEYGTDRPRGLAVYLRIRPREMSAGM
jgi:hypothetical protein